MYFDNYKENNCCGCKACEDICPMGAIRFDHDAEGFWYPHIDADKCIHCQKCIQVCSFNLECSSHYYDVYAGWNRKSKFRDVSSSGGIFIALAQYVLSQGGVIVGAAYNEDLYVEHIFIDSEENLGKLQKSKYVQSDTRHIYKRVENLLAQGVLVLYSGTPCQISAMKRFIKREYVNLILCEVLCYGVPSPKVYRKYLEYNQCQHKSKIISINFKDKRYGWDNYATAIKFSNGKTICQYGGDSYKKFMHKGYSLRPSCFNCVYDINNSFADVTLGDFYNVNKYTSVKIHKNGVSCVMIRSEKGHKLLQEIEPNMKLFSVDYEKFSKNEKKKHKEFDLTVRRHFFENLNQCGYEQCIQMLERTKTKDKLVNKFRAFRKRFFYSVRL